MVFLPHTQSLGYLWLYVWETGWKKIVEMCNILNMYYIKYF